MRQVRQTRIDLLQHALVFNQLIGRHSTHARQATQALDTFDDQGALALRVDGARLQFRKLKQLLAPLFLNDRQLLVDDAPARVKEARFALRESEALADESLWCFKPAAFRFGDQPPQPQFTRGDFEPRLLQLGT